MCAKWRKLGFAYGCGCHAKHACSHRVPADCGKSGGHLQLTSPGPCQAVTRYGSDYSKVQFPARQTVVSLCGKAMTLVPGLRFGTGFLSHSQYSGTPRLGCVEQFHCKARGSFVRPVSRTATSHSWRVFACWTAQR